jgi:hypothetical protein
MSQQVADVPRFVQIIGRYSALIGMMALLGLLAGAVFAAVNPPVFTSRALVLMAPPSCPQGAICGGPLSSPGYHGAKLLQSLPAGVQAKLLPGHYLWVTARAGTPAQAEATAEAAAISYLSYDVSASYPGWPGSARILEPAMSASGTAPLTLLRDDALLGAVSGLLLGVIAALAAGGSTIDTPAAPPGYDVGGTRRDSQVATAITV